MSIEYRRLCVGIDFGAASENALRHGCALAEKLAAELHLLHVVPELDFVLSRPRNVPGGETVEQLLDRLHADAATRLQALPSWHAEVQIVRSVCRGVADLEICRYAQQHRIDLLVVGTHGRTGLPHAVMGSIAERVARRCPCPVLLVRHAPPVAEG